MNKIVHNLSEDEIRPLHIDLERIECKKRLNLVYRLKCKNKPLFQACKKALHVMVAGDYIDDFWQSNNDISGGRLIGDTDLMILYTIKKDDNMVTPEEIMNYMENILKSIVIVLGFSKDLFNIK